MENDIDGTKELILPDDYSVYAGCHYVVDGVVTTVDMTGTVADIKRLLNAKEVKACDVFGRKLPFYM